METVRVSADLVLYFETNSRPRYKTPTLGKNEVDGQVKNWLSVNEHLEGTEKYAFVNRWYDLFELPIQPKPTFEYQAERNYEYRILPARRFPIRPRTGPQPTNGQPFLFAKGLSWCCRARTLLVESMPGGFVTQNCEFCGKFRTATPDELPDRRCGTCATQLAVRMVDGMNYFYVCPGCGDRRKLASLLPHYSELFGYEHSVT